MVCNKLLTWVLWGHFLKFSTQLLHFCAIFSPPPLNPVDFRLSLIRIFMTTSFTCLSSVTFKSALPVVSIHATRRYRMTHLPLALILHTPDVYKCKTLLYFSHSNRSASSFAGRLFWVTHMHTCTHFVSRDVGQINLLISTQTRLNVEAGQSNSYVLAQIS